MSTFAYTLTILCAIGAATAAGTFFTFSTFTIAGLRRLESAQGAAAMQAINKEAPTPLYMLLLFGTGVAYLVLMVHAILNLQGSAAAYPVTAGAVYISGVVVTTIGYHVPRNDRLDGVDPNSAEGMAYWAVYLREWVRMNHVRTVAPLLSAVLLILSLR